MEYHHLSKAKGDIVTDSATIPIQNQQQAAQTSSTSDDSTFTRAWSGFLSLFTVVEEKPKPAVEMKILKKKVNPSNPPVSEVDYGTSFPIPLLPVAFVTVPSPLPFPPVSRDMCPLPCFGQRCSEGNPNFGFRIPSVNFPVPIKLVFMILLLSNLYHVVLMEESSYVKRKIQVIYTQ